VLAGGFTDKFTGFWHWNVLFMNVLVADDSQGVREHLRAILSDIEGLEVIGEAKDGLEARDVCLEQKPDVVILDLRMPRRNGLDALRDIKESNPDIRVIILTNYPYPQYRRRCMEEGADYFFDKSSEFEKVIDVLKQPANGGQHEGPL